MIIPDAKLITLGEDEIVIRTELESVERVIHLNRSSHEGVEPSVQGHNELEWVYSPDFEMVRLPCDPESAQRYLDLR